MNKLQNDYCDLKEKIEASIQKVDIAIDDCQDSIARGEETLQMFKEYQDRMSGLGKNLTKNMGYKVKRSTKSPMKAQRDWLRPNQKRGGSVNVLAGAPKKV